MVSGSMATRPARMVSAGEPIRALGVPDRFCGRGGWKLEGALARLRVEVAGRDVLDVGAGTGGFTDCLLQRGACHVVALDVGRGQLHERLLADPRVRQRERTHARDVDGADIGAPFALVVADVSFISLTSLAPRLAGDLASRGADVVVMVKPQFEVGRAVAARGRGVVKEPALWVEAMSRVVASFRREGAALLAAVPSSLPGAEGNREFFLHLRAHSSSPDADRSLAGEPAALVAAAAAEAAAGGRGGPRAAGSAAAGRAGAA